MSEVGKNGFFTTKLRNETFLYVADNSSLGILIIQKGYLKYYNKKFQEILGYSPEEISKWKKRDFFKIIHPEDLNQLLQNLKIEDDKTVSFRFRAITKESRIINVEFYLCIIKYNNQRAYLLSYSPLEEVSKEEIYTPKKITIKSKKKILLDYNPDIINLLNKHNLRFDIFKNWSYREEEN